MIELPDIYRARQTISPYIARTPLVPAYSLSDQTTQVKFKLETLQDIGAFKIRGATNALVRLDKSALARGVVCASTGNHGRALAAAARAQGTNATICMSRLVPQDKINAVVGLGAKVHIEGDSQDSAQLLVNRLVSEQDMIEIPPFDHPDIIAGQATIGLEILEDWPEVDTIIVGVSGGGLASGVALAAKSIKPAIRIIGVSPSRGAAMAASLRAGKPVDVTELQTLADSLGGGIGLHNRYTFDLTRRLVDDLLLIDEEQIACAMRHLYFEERMVVEGAGAIGAAILIEQAINHRLKVPLGHRVAIIVSGRNVDMKQFHALMNC